MTLSMERIRATPLDPTRLIHEVKVDFLREGDLLKAVRGEGAKQEVIFAVADMDGHAVSPNYGWSVGSHHYDTGTGKAYINIKRLDRPSDYYTHEQANLRNRQGKHFDLYNESLAPEQEGWTVYSTAAVAAREPQARLELKVTAASAAEDAAILACVEAARALSTAREEHIFYSGKLAAAQALAAAQTATV